MGKPANEIWKPVPLEPYSKYYHISNHGRIKSLERTTTCIGHWGEYVQTKAETIKALRTNGKENHLFTELYCTIDGKRQAKTVYPHKLVAMAFKKPPRDPKRNKVIFKNGVHTDIWPDNLEWVSQSYLSTKQMAEATPERRNWIGRYQRKIKTSAPIEVGKLKKLMDEGHSVNSASEILGKSPTWGYTHVDKIIRD